MVIDANVLYSIELTDLLLTFAAHRLVRLHWSPTILGEVRRNLAKRVDLTPDAIAYRIDRMNRAVPGALDEAPEVLIAAMPIIEHDRHVLALAVHVEADCIVTFNLRDFPASAWNRTASKPSIRTVSRWPLPRATHRGPMPPLSEIARRRTLSDNDRSRTPRPARGCPAQLRQSGASGLARACLSAASHWERSAPVRRGAWSVAGRDLGEPGHRLLEHRHGDDRPVGPTGAQFGGDVGPVAVVGDVGLVVVDGSSFQP